MKRHPILSNAIIIVAVAIMGLIIAYLSLSIFTKHGERSQVPNVVGISYTEAINKLHDAGFKIEIRDSLYLDNVKPGYVVEQYPGGDAVVKPGRKVFLYINAVYPKEVVIDPSSSIPGTLALKGYSQRQAYAIIEELGFKNIRVVYVSGITDRVVKITANGKPVHVAEKTPINAAIVIEVYDNSGQSTIDSLKNQLYWEEKAAERDSISRNNNQEPAGNEAEPGNGEGEEYTVE